MSARSRTFIAIIAATLLFATQLSTARADDPFRDLHFITENYAPFNFKEGGILQGSAVDILLRMFAVAKSSKTAADVEVLPWSRGYRLAQTQENTVLFVTTRTPRAKTCSNGWVPSCRRRFPSLPRNQRICI